MVRIAIDGNIGCGKSTAIKELSEKYKVYAEDLDAWGDWLVKYYDNPSRYGLGFQMTVLLSHLKQQKEVLVDETVIYERCSYTCNHIFGDLLVDDKIMEQAELDLCKSYERAFNNSVTDLIYLRTTPEVCKSRIVARDRSCESSIDISYLEKLHAKYESVYNNGYNVIDGIHIHIIDATSDQKTVLDKINYTIEMLL